jgi:hypothetical protein
MGDLSSLDPTGDPDLEMGSVQLLRDTDQNDVSRMTALNVDLDPPVAYQHRR